MRRSRLLRELVFILLTAIAVARIANTWRHTAQTSDESPNIACGMQWLDLPVHLTSVRADAERDFREYVAARSGDLLRMAQVLTPDQHAAEDLVQTALLKVWRSWPRIRATDDPTAYVRKVMVNTAARGWRRRWRGEIPTADLPDLPGQDPVAPVGERDALVRALRSLPTRQRAAIALRYLADLDDEAIAASLGCTVSTARSQISRGLATLRVRTQQDALSTQESS